MRKTAAFHGLCVVVRSSLGYNRIVNQDSPRGPAFYEHFFGFHRPPFSLAPDTRFRFQSASHAAALKEITYALERREPLIVVTGEIGTGKTLLCRTVVEQSGRSTFVSVINDPNLACDDLLKRMLEDFGVISKDRTVMTPTSRHDLVHAMQEFLGSLTPIHAHAAVIIDEAQHVQPDVLEQIRLVSNIQDEGGTLLQIVLVGQTDLDKLLAKPELRQLAQRVSRFVRLEPLSADELALYIEHRIGVAREQRLASTFPGARDLERELAEWDGSVPDPPFAPAAIAAIGRISQGIPRVVNLLCDRALEAAYSRQLRTVDAPLINAAAAALNLATGAVEPAEPAGLPVWPELQPTGDAEAGEASAAGASRTKRYGVLAAVGVVAVAASWFGVRSLSERSATAPAQSVPARASQPPRPQNASPQAAAPPEAAPPTPSSQPPITSSTSPSSAAPAAAPPSGVSSGAPPRPASPAAASPSTSPAGAHATGTTAAGATLPGRPAASAAPASNAADGFEIVVASFHTATRANDVAAAITALGEPVHQRTAGDWKQVLAGPYSSADRAREAQQRLERAGYVGTHVTPVAR